MKRKPLDIYDRHGKPIDDDEFIKCREVFKRQFDARFRGMAMRAIDEERTLTEIIEAAFIQGMAFCVMPTKSTEKSDQL